MSVNHQIEPSSYETARDELVQIADAFKSNDIGLDDVATKVGRAAYLVKFCRQRIADTESQVNEILADIA